MRERPQRRVLLALLASISLHVLALLLGYLLVPKSVKVAMYRVYVLGLPRMERKLEVGRPEQGVPQMEMERPKMGALPKGIIEFGLPMEEGEMEGPVGPMEEVKIDLIPGAKSGAPDLERPAWKPPTELAPLERPLPGGLEEGITLGIGRRHTLVLIDPEDKTKLKGHLHIPVRRRKPGTRGGPRPLVPPEFTHLSLMEHAAGLPLPTFLEVHLHGYAWYDSLDVNDLRAFPFVIVDSIAGIRVRSVADLADYLEEGGFAMIRDGVIFRQTLNELRRRGGKRAVLVSVTLEHPLFHSFYDITEYSEGGARCDQGGCLPVMPLTGIEWYGRLVAVSTYLGYTYCCPCAHNKLFINILVYGLIQPGSLGRHYVIDR